MDIMNKAFFPADLTDSDWITEKDGFKVPTEDDELGLSVEPIERKPFTKPTELKPSGAVI